MDSSILKHHDIIADITDVATTPIQNLVEPDWMKRFYQVEENESFSNEIFHSDEEEDEDFSDWVKESCLLPFDRVDVKCLYDIRPEKKPRQQRQSRGRESKVLETPDTKATNDWDIFINQSGRMRERDCAKYWSNLSLHGNISRKDRYIIMDRMRTMQDQCTKTFYEKKTKRMERITENNPKPLMEIEIIKDNGETISFSALLDSGTTKAIIALDLAVKHGLKGIPVPYDHILKDAQGEEMRVEGMTVINVHAQNVDGSLKKIESFTWCHV